MQIVVCAVYLVLAAAVPMLRGRAAYPAAKALAGLGFCAVAAASAWQLGGSPWPWPLPAGFALCAAGDVAMGLYNLHRRPAALRWGVLLFAAGHLCFLAGLWRRMRPGPAAFALAAAAAAALALLLCRKTLDMGRQGGWGVAYCFAVSLMAAQSGALALAAPQAGTALFAAGAALFWLSDLILLFLYFSRWRNSRALHAANLASYYLGMLLLALSMGQAQYALL
ncbi:MAG TPA: lysoplasmalogenase [Candidatus Gemmiger faecigallinarum]|nr:lysoplasmalogenase [Candidatus Gemmiger faecigallinarum]